MPGYSSIELFFNGDHTMQIDKIPMNAQMKVSRAITRLVVKHPFFGSLALSLRVEADTSIGTMCTDGKSILWNPDFVDAHDQEEIVGVMAHEVLHVTFKHMLRRGKRDPVLWNIACDFAINPILKDNDLFKLPEAALDNSEYHGLNAEAIYGRLPEDAAEKYSQGSGFGEVSDASDGNGNAPSEAEVKQMEADIDSKVMMAANGAKAVGNLPSAIKELIEVMKRSQVDWRDCIRRFVGGDQPDDYSMRKPHRRMYHTSRIVAPSIQMVGAGDVVIGIDTSGSVSKVELSYFLGELNAISADIKPQSVTVITCDMTVQTVRRYEQGEEIEMIEVNGRGGTLVRPVFDYIEENNINVDNMVYFSDMCISDYPECPHYPTMWVSAYAIGSPAPWGETVFLKT